MSEDLEPSIELSENNEVVNNELSDTETCEEVPKPEEPKKKSKSCFGVGQYKKKDKLSATEARKANLAKARAKKEAKRASEYKFEFSEDSDSSDEELIIRPPTPKKEKKVKEDQDIRYQDPRYQDPRYEELQRELLQIKTVMMKQAKEKRKPREKAINVNILGGQAQQPVEDAATKRLREKVTMQFN